MDESQYSAKEALSMMKAGYPFLSIIQKKKTAFFYRKNKVHVLSDNGGIVLSDLEFLSLYSESVFYLDREAMEEETVDIKKDEEYYSWRQ